MSNDLLYDVQCTSYAQYYTIAFASQSVRIYCIITPKCYAINCNTTTVPLLPPITTYYYY